MRPGVTSVPKIFVRGNWATERIHSTIAFMLSSDRSSPWIPCLHKGNTSRFLHIHGMGGRESARGGQCPYQHTHGRGRSLGRRGTRSFVRPKQSLILHWTRVFAESLC